MGICVGIGLYVMQSPSYFPYYLPNIPYFHYHIRVFKIQMIYTTIKFNKFINVILKYIFRYFKMPTISFTIDVQLRDKFNKVELDALFYLVYNVGLICRIYICRIIRFHYIVIFALI